MKIVWNGMPAAKKTGTFLVIYVNDNAASGGACDAIVFRFLPARSLASSKHVLA
jgi:hypothetical protein